ncbi:uncharacterized protein LOC120176249 [Hibiscus syriacus]|uniref:uncharacterized protein LOC120176249 n=1 Tax=Hibiscus syriacus TaxID=106335 RepID=UPI001920D7EF|nr:uncharacterized protein LOC120176249 [Hibiscus syriacus]
MQFDRQHYGSASMSSSLPWSSSYAFGYRSLENPSNSPGSPLQNLLVGSTGSRLAYDNFLRSQFTMVDLISTYLNRMAAVLHGIMDTVQKTYQLFQITLITVYTGKITCLPGVNIVSNSHNSFMELWDTLVFTVLVQRWQWSSSSSNSKISEIWF